MKLMNATDLQLTQAYHQNQSHTNITAEFFMTSEQQRIISEVLPKGFSLQFASKPVRQRTTSFSKTHVSATSAVTSIACPHRTEKTSPVAPIITAAPINVTQEQFYDEVSSLSPFASHQTAANYQKNPPYSLSLNEDYDDQSASLLSGKSVSAAANATKKRAPQSAKRSTNNLVPRAPRKQSISSHQAVSSSGMDSEDSKKCFNILHSMQKQKSSLPFLYPVDPIAQGCPDYFTVIRDPIDLQTIERNLKQNMYQSPTQFAADVRKVWNNSYLYNSRDSHIYYLTLDMDKLFEKKFKEVTQSSFGASQVKNMQNYVKILAQAIQGQSAHPTSNMQHQYKSIHTAAVAAASAPPRAPRAPPAKKAQAAPVKSAVQIKMETPMTMQEKKQLGLDIMQLPHDNLRGIWDIVKTDDNQEFDGNVLRFDLDKLSVRKTRELESYVKQKMSAINKKLSKKHAKAAGKQASFVNRLTQQTSICHDEETALTNNIDAAHTQEYFYIGDTTQTTLPSALTSSSPAAYWMPNAKPASPSHIHQSSLQTENTYHTPYLAHPSHCDDSESSFISGDSDDNSR